MHCVWKSPDETIYRDYTSTALSGSNNIFYSSQNIRLSYEGNDQPVHEVNVDKCRILCG